MVLQPVSWERQVHKGQIDSAFAQQFQLRRWKAVRELEFNFRVRLSERANHGCQVIQVQPAWETDYKCACNQSGGLPRLAGCLGGTVENGAGVPVQSLARAGDFHARMPPFEQCRFELFLEVLYLAAQRRLGHAQPRCCSCKVEFLCHGNEMRRCRNSMPPP
jgi:hypothetical protein